MTTSELDAMAERFTAATIPRKEWTHEAHVRVGAWHVRRFGPDEALSRLRVGIRRLNEANGIANTPTDGYHETITAVYVRLLARALGDCPDELPFDARVARILAGPLAQRSALLRYYSREVLMSSLARAEWVEPDLEPLP